MTTRPGAQKASDSICNLDDHKIHGKKLKKRRYKKFKPYKYSTVEKDED